MKRVGRTSPPPRSTAAALALGLALTACGGGVDVSQAHAELAALIPAETAAAVRVASLDTLSKQVAVIAELQGQAAEKVDARDLFTLAGGVIGDARHVDAKKPIVCAVTAKRATPPGVVLIVPTTDASAYRASLPGGGATAEVEGAYVAVPITGKYERPTSPGAIPAGLDGAAVAMHADVAKLAAVFGPAIDMGLKTMEAQMMATASSDDEKEAIGAVAELYAEAARAILSSTNTLDLSVDMPDGKLDVQGALTTLPNSALDGWRTKPVDLTPLLAGLPRNGSFEALVAGNWEELWPRYMELIEPVYDLYPEDMRAGLRKAIEASRDFATMSGDAFAMSGDLFSGEGMQMAMLSRPKDGAAVLEKLQALLGDEAWKELDLFSLASKTTRVDGADVLEIEMTPNTERLAAMMKSLDKTGSGPSPSDQEALRMLFGDGPIRFSTAVSGDRCGMAIGPDATARATAALTATDGGVAASTRLGLERLTGCSPMFVERIDMGHMMRGAVAASGLGVVPANVSADMMFYGGIDDGGWRFGMTMDVAGMTDLFASMSPR